jgi:hypothetical protein
MNNVQKWQKIADNRLLIWQKAKDENVELIAMVNSLREVLEDAREKIEHGDISEAYTIIVEGLD